MGYSTDTHQAAIRHYRVGGIGFGIEIESPWKEMEYSEHVKRRISDAAAGKASPVVPVRAGDKEPSRTFVQGKDELVPGCDSHSLDLSAERVFSTDDGDSSGGTRMSGEDDVFRLRILAPESVIPDTTGLITEIKDTLPRYLVHSCQDGTLIKMDSGKDTLGSLLISSDFSTGEYFPAKGMTARRVSGMANILLRMMVTYNSVSVPSLMMHSSVVAKNGEAVMFLGASGTGKSTHSRLWLENIPGAELVNDDNPILRLEDGRAYVYGTPWSGKTPCYRNVRFPVKAIVRLTQGPENRISRVSGLHAYASLMGAASTVRWERRVMEAVITTASKIAEVVPFFDLQCLPDADAARTCHDAIGL